jgi:hypothetical protein
MDKIQTIEMTESREPDEKISISYVVEKERASPNLDFTAGASNFFSDSSGRRPTNCCNCSR